MSSDVIVLSDRIKELSHSVGTGSVRLDGAATGFSSFGSAYSYNDVLFYAITDGTNYEVGSGQYVSITGVNYLTRNPFKSTNSNNLVNFSTGIKEVYVTYPGKYAVFTSSGIGSFQQPQASGVAFWGSNQILDYDSKLTWNKTTDKLGISNSNPQYALDIGGTNEYSSIRVSGINLGASGVLFSGSVGYSGGRQLEPFLRNQLDTTTGTNGVFSLSGIVDEKILFKKQNAGLVFAGPPSGCSPPATCSPDYPTFRQITMKDLPAFSFMYNDYLKIATFANYAAGTGTIGAASSNNKGVMFYAEDTNRLWISNGTSWKYSAFS